MKIYKNLTINKIIELFFYSIWIFFTRIFWNIQNALPFLKTRYVEWLSKENYQASEDFVALAKNDIILQKDVPKIISFYLPQYYENEINNKYFGKGFMEWYNVTKAIPQFTGHYQPHLPIDVGFYDLTHDDIMYRQIELAKKYGIYGFCFYYYWFSGDTLLEKPILNFLNNKELDFPFCLMWTNETWTSIWGNGNHREIIKEQKLIDGDEERFVQSILKYIEDKRYIRINNRPLLIIYQSEFFEKEKMKSFLNYVRKRVKEILSEDLYIITTNSGNKIEQTVQDLNLEAVVEFTHQIQPLTQYIKSLRGKYVNPHFKGKIVDIPRALKENAHLIQKNYKTFKCIYPGWDNTARKAYSYKGCYVFDMNPKIFKQWFYDLVVWTKQNNKKEEQLVFVNAWNEWAEGAHLEPDRKYGYAYLQAIKDVLEETQN